MNLLNVVQHTSADYLGLMEDHLEGRRISFRYFRPFTERGDIPRAGDICENPAGTMHNERTGSEGGSFLFAKK